MSSSSLGQSYTIGFVGNPKKNKQFFEPFLQYCNTNRADNLKCIEIHTEKEEEIDSQPKVDVLFFKVTDDMVVESIDNNAHQRLENLRRYISMCQDTEIVESLETTHRFLDRIEIHTFLEKQLEHNLHVRVPRMYFIRNGTDLDQVAKESGLVFPLVCKTVAACGKSETHHMAIVFNVDQLYSVVNGNNVENNHQVLSPLIAQQFINHNSTLYKVYVLGERVFYQVKPSLKNFDLSINQSIITFDSQKPFETTISDHAIMESNLQEVNYDATEGNDKVFKQVGDQLRKALDVSLFGFDLIRDCDQNEDSKVAPYCVVDVNYFPTYKGISRETLFEYVIEHLCKRVDLRRQNKASL